MGLVNRSLNWKVLRSSYNLIENHSKSEWRRQFVQLAAVKVAHSPESKFREYLASRPKPQRFTDQQRDMVRYIFAQHSHFDAEQLIDDMKQAGLQVSRATAYRTLGKLVDAGLLRRLDVG